MLSMDNITMEQKLLNEIDRIIWDVNTTDAEKAQAVQRLMYQWGACQDAKTEQMFGDDDNYPYPNMRRC